MDNGERSFAMVVYNYFGTLVISKRLELYIILIGS